MENTWQRHQCPCCGYYTFETEYGHEPLFDYCPVCAWQYDLVAHNKPDYVGGANRISLNEARQKFQEYGTTKHDFMENGWCRAPLEEELPENN